MSSRDTFQFIHLDADLLVKMNVHNHVFTKGFQSKRSLLVMHTILIKRGKPFLESHNYGYNVGDD